MTYKIIRGLTDMEKRQPIDWDIVFALMECYGMLDRKGFPKQKRNARPLPTGGSSSE